MALIRKRDIEEVRARTNIADIVSDHVTLKSAGVGSLKGLCPFHDERTPSFHVRPHLGHFHCFGCGESGDVYSFVQKIDHVTFSEAVERLAERINYQLTYEDGAQAPDYSRRARLLLVNRAAEQFFQAQLLTEDATPAHAFLGGRSFDAEAASHFGVGYAPNTWDALTTHLREQGFTMQELKDAGLVSTNDRGSSYDRFRGRVIWPIRDTSGQTLGFGARKLFDEDKGPKYLNTPETPVYHKQQVLYGLDLAKKTIAREHEVVVVEGYTDVMAAHLAGVTSAVATCGTAFGVDHIKLIRRIMDDESGSGRVVFTFDPDEAGQKAALRAFQEEKRFTAQTFVAQPPAGLDPCDLRLAQGNQAVVDLIAAAQPMYEFVIRQHLSHHDLDTVEGRVAALRQAAPVVAGIRDRALQPEYVRLLAKWLGMDLQMVDRAVQQARRGSTASSHGPQTMPPRAMTPRRAPMPAGGRFDAREPEGFEPPPEDAFEPPREHAAPDLGLPQVRLADLPNDHLTRLERDTLIAILQYPTALPGTLLDELLAVHMNDASLATVRDGILASRTQLTEPGWIGRIADEVPQSFRGLVSELAMMPLPAGPDEERVYAYVRDIARTLIERDLLRTKASLVGALSRTDPVQQAERFRELQQEIAQLEVQKRRLRGE